MSARVGYCPTCGGETTFVHSYVPQPGLFGSAPRITEEKYECIMCRTVLSDDEVKRRGWPLLGDRDTLKTSAFVTDEERAALAKWPKRKAAAQHAPDWGMYPK